MKIPATICLALLALFATSASQAQSNNDDLRFIPDDCCLVLQFNMKKLIEYEGSDSKSLRNIAELFKNKFKVDLFTLDRLTIQCCGIPNRPNSMSQYFGAVLEFSKPIDKDAILAGFPTTFEDIQIDDQRYHRPRFRSEPSIYFHKDKSIILGSDQAILAMLKKKSGRSRIASHLKSADPNAEIKGAFQHHSLYTELVKKLAAQIPISPFKIEKVLGTAESAVISGNVESSTPVLIRVECKSEEGAETLAKKSKFLFNFAKALIPIGRQSLEDEKKAIEARPMNYYSRFRLGQIDVSFQGLDIADKVVDWVRVDSNQKSLTIKLRRMQGLKDMVPSFAKLIETHSVSMFNLVKDLESVPRIIDISGHKDREK